MSDDLRKLSIRALTSGFKAQTFTPTDLLEQFIAAIEERNGQINAFLDSRFSSARQEAKGADTRWLKGKERSEIDGIPFGVKVNIAVKGLPWHAGIGAYRDIIAEKNAACVELLIAGGAIPLGIVNMHEGALGATTDNPHFGRCNNPWDLAKTPGGSSGGSAAAVAAGFCSFALGTDTMGSVRIPSAYCGVVGHKPSFDLVPSDGLWDLSPSLDHIGPHAKYVDDIFLIMSVLTDAALSDVPDIPKIGIVNWGSAVDTDAVVVSSFHDACAFFGETGPVKEIDLTHIEFGRLRRAGLIVSEVEGHIVHEAALSKNRNGFSDEFAGMLEWGAHQSREKIENAYNAIKSVGAEVRELLANIDVLIMPTAPQFPFFFESDVPVNQADFTALANFSGVPATSVPLSSGGSPPSSMQILAAKGRDGVALDLALRFEQERGLVPLPF